MDNLDETRNSHAKLAEQSALALKMLDEAICREKQAIKMQIMVYGANLLPHKSNFLAPIPSTSLLPNFGGKIPKNVPPFLPTKIDEQKEKQQNFIRQKAKFLAIMEKLEQKSERTRQILSRKKYAEYLNKLKSTNCIEEKILGNNKKCYKDVRIASRFMLDKTGNILLDKKSGKPYICFEDMFDCIHRGYQKPKYGGLRAVYAELKESYANITLQCVTIYLKSCGHQNVGKESDEKWEAMDEL